MPRQRRFTAVPFDHGEPIRRISAAPLAALAIIGLAYPISALPASTHALVFAMPTVTSPSLETRRARISQLSDGGLYWNDTSITPAQLRDLLYAPRDVGNYLTFEASGTAPYGAVVAALNIIAHSGTNPVWLCTPSDVHPGRFERRWPDREPGSHDAECTLFVPQ